MVKVTSSYDTLSRLLALMSSIVPALVPHTPSVLLMPYPSSLVYYTQNGNGYKPSPSQYTSGCLRGPSGNKYYTTSATYRLLLVCTPVVVPNSTWIVYDAGSNQALFDQVTLDNENTCNTTGVSQVTISVASSLAGPFYTRIPETNITKEIVTLATPEANAKAKAAFTTAGQYQFVKLTLKGMSTFKFAEFAVPNASLTAVAQSNSVEDGAAELTVDGETETCFAKRVADCGGYSNTAKHNGKLYATLNDQDIAQSSYNFNCENTYKAIKKGWSVAPNDAESKQAITSHKWGAYYMVTSDGYAWYTPQQSSSPSKYTTGYLQRSGDTYKTSACTARLLLVCTPIETPESAWVIYDAGSRLTLFDRVFIDNDHTCDSTNRASSMQVAAATSIDGPFVEVLAETKLEKDTSILWTSPEAEEAARTAFSNAGSYRYVKLEVEGTADMNFAEFSIPAVNLSAVASSSTVDASTAGSLCGPDLWTWLVDLACVCLIMVYGICYVHGIWHMAYGIWHVLYGTCCFTLSVQRTLSMET